MPTSPMNDVIRHLRRAAGGDRTDGELLQCFLDHHDEAAFEALVRRHGPMVLGVCRRVLAHPHDAEDAFQATFLVLVRKADTVVPRELVGNWLYGVAYRTARKAKAMTARQHARQRQVIDVPQSEPPDDAAWQDLRPLLDQELHRLPDKYRVPVVLCDLQGKTRKEAAQQLGWPEGTLSWRLASARTLLAQRVARHGLTLSAGSLALLLTEQASAGLSAPLVISTVQAATLSAAGSAVAAGVISTQVAALTEGVIQTMYWTRWKLMMAALLAMSVLGTGVGIASYRTLALPATPIRAADRFVADERRLEVQRRESAVPADAGRERERRPAPAFEGKITAIAADGKLLTLEVSAGRGEEPKKQDVKLTDQSAIEFAGVLKDLGKKLKVGDRAVVWLHDGSKDTAARVEAQREPDRTGKITAVSVDEKTLTLEFQGRNRGDGLIKTEIKLTDKTKRALSRGEEETKPKVDYLASVWLQEGSTDTAEALQVDRPRSDVAGEITAVSADGKVLTVQSRTRGGEVTKTDVKLNDQTKVEFIGAAKAESTKLTVGHVVSVWLQQGSADTAATVLTSSRRSPDVSGTITTVSADGRTLTLESRKRGEDQTTKMEIKLTEKTTVEYAGTEKEDEKKLTVGYGATVWLQEGSKDTAVVVRAAKPKERGR